jgi:N-acetyl-gamma-glutamylphosphate reductase
MQMPYVSIVGAAGYTGQETLDRVLGHPELELYAVGSDSLAGRTRPRSTRASIGTAASASRG